ncbi:PLP-dependent aminotransferase family protein [Demequina sediminicola]|uniref:aminotransferase-like domain-containing protein n=1 Tax=Demequina sediminicola TaxID=1095026 RepID=UPI00078284B5|nr:PLP-dependent aminotransferase family protein [Demequina sediminicola]
MRTTADQLRDVLDHWRSGTGPLYIQLADAIVSLAESGSLEHGTRLPSERALAESLHLSRNTVTAAYQHLRDDDWLDVRAGAAPTLGSRARGLDAMSLQDRFAKILPGAQAPLVGLSSACPPPAPSVVEAFADPRATLESSPTFGTGYAALGDPELVEVVVERLRADGIDANPDEVVITSGGQQALWLALTALAGPTSPVALESVTYPGVFDAISAAGSRPLALPMGPDGLDVLASVKLLRAARPGVAYVTTFHNPTGTTLTPAGAQAIAEAAAATETTLIDDRITADLALGGQAAPPFASLGTGASVVTISGLSKVFWGGMRIGWLLTNATLAAHLRQRKAAMDLGSSGFMQRIARELMADCYDETLAWRREALRESLDATVDAMREHAPEWKVRMPDGGPSLWVEVPGINTDRFAARAEDAGVPVAPGSAFEVAPGGGTSYFRLPFYLPAEDMRLGVKVLADRAA